MSLDGSAAAHKAAAAPPRQMRFRAAPARLVSGSGLSRILED